MLDESAPVAGILQAAAAGIPVAFVPQDIPATVLLKRTAATNLTAMAADNISFAAISSTPNVGRKVFIPDQNFGTPLETESRTKALKEVDEQLVSKGLISKEGKVSTETKQHIEFESTFSLPTPGIIVKGCLDDCDVCEPWVKERNQLENDLLRKQIELLDKSQEYRCCPPSPVITVDD